MHDAWVTADQEWPVMLYGLNKSWLEWGELSHSPLCPGHNTGLHRAGDKIPPGRSWLASVSSCTQILAQVGKRCPVC